MVGFGGQYEVYRENLTDDQIRAVVYKIATSERFHIGNNSHILLNEADVIVGYIGSSSVELCCPEGQNPNLYRLPHKHLRRIFRAATNRVFHKFEGLFADLEQPIVTQPYLLSS